MKILNLIIKQEYFDEILAGTKTEEYRDVKPTTFKKYLRYVCCGEEFEDIDDIPDEEPYKSELEKEGFDVCPIEYDALRLYVGYNSNRDSMLVEVKDIILQYIVDDNGNPREYTYKDKNGEETTYLESQMIYVLGEILEKDIHPKFNELKDKYLPIVEAELKKYDLTVKDLTKAELKEMLEEAHDLENPNGSVIFDGYFGGTALLNLQFTKQMKKVDKANKRYDARFLKEIAQYGLERSDFTDEEYNEAIAELRGEDEGMLYEDGILGSMFLSKRQWDKELAKNTSKNKDESTQKK